MNERRRAVPQIRRAHLRPARRPEARPGGALALALLLATAGAGCALAPRPVVSAELDSGHEVALEAGRAARQAEADGRTGVIFETSMPGSLERESVLEPSEPPAEDASPTEPLEIHVFADGSVAVGDRLTSDLDELAEWLTTGAEAGFDRAVVHVESDEVDTELVHQVVELARARGIEASDVVVGPAPSP